MRPKDQVPQGLKMSSQIIDHTLQDAAKRESAAMPQGIDLQHRENIDLRVKQAYDFGHFKPMVGQHYRPTLFKVHRCVGLFPWRQ